MKKNVTESIAQLKYSQIISSLLYITHKTRLDKAYIVQRLSRYTHNLSKEHRIALERVFMYLRGASNYYVTKDSLT